MIRTTEIDSLTNFQKNAKAFVSRLEATKSPMVLTVNGKAKVVIQDAEAYQAMLDDLDRVRFISAMKESEGAVQRGEVKELDEAFDEIDREFDL